METELYEVARSTAEYLPENKEFYAAAASTVVTSSMYLKHFGCDSTEEGLL